MTAHRGHQERFGAEAFEEVGGTAEDEGNVSDAAAARRQRNSLPGTDAAWQVERFEGCGDGGRDVGDDRALELLADADKGWVRHSGCIRKRRIGTRRLFYARSAKKPAVRFLLPPSSFPFVCPCPNSWKRL